MSAYQNWVQQRERLREALQRTGDAASAAYETRHAIAQVEQNAMAEQPDDLLRQQTGILFSCVKTSLNLLDISVTTKVWVAQTQMEPRAKKAWLVPLLVAAVCLLIAGGYGYSKGLWLVWLPVAVATVCVAVTLWALRRKPANPALTDDRLNVTAKPDADKLFSAIDAQLKAIDRYINDFAYLNEQSALQNQAPDSRNAALLAELMQTAYECEGESGEEVIQTAHRLLSSLGIQAVAYQPRDARLFTVLPSLSQTRTLVPALLSLKDGALLYRGTAAVISADTPQSDAETPSGGAL